VSAGSHEGADGTAPNLQQGWCSECEHQYTAVAGFIKGEGTYLFGGLRMIYHIWGDCNNEKM